MKMSERQFQRTVSEYATLRKWLVHAERPARRQSGSYSTPIEGDRGFPDLVLARDGEVVFAELKVGSNRPTVGQRAWLAALPNSYLWYPKDMDEIIKRLK